MSNHAPTVLIVLDGWGHAVPRSDNAISRAHTPHWDRLWTEHPHALVSGSGTAVGLPAGQMGNSEVGHMNLGAGRVVHQDLTRISGAISDHTFASNPALNQAIDRANRAGGNVHVCGLLSAGGVHSHEDHIFAMLELAARRATGKVQLHAFLDGRDTPPQSAAPSIDAAERFCLDHPAVTISTISGRYFAMDRNHHWDRTERAFDAMVHGRPAQSAVSARDALEAAYQRGEGDEFVQPTIIHAAGTEPPRITDGDSVICMNFRADRIRQITNALVQKDFSGFPRSHRPDLADYVMLTRYADNIDASCAFESEVPANTLGEFLAARGLTQLRIAETEKYAHVTFFFSGGREQPFAGEQRILVPSPDVATYDLQPEMSAQELTDELVAAIRGGHFDFIVCNYANGDMVGHTGVLAAAITAVEVLDECLGRVVDALREVGGQALITADHGNVEQMADSGTGQPHTAHTAEPVPLVYAGPRQPEILADGALADIAPSLLALMDIDPPPEMSGRSLIKLPTRRASA